MTQAPVSGGPVVLLDDGTSRVTRPLVIRTARLAPWRQRRLRHLAARHLDNLLGSPDPWDLAEPLDWHKIHADRGVPERTAIGAELAAAGWMP